MTSDPLTIIADLLRLYCDEGPAGIHAEHTETVAACRLLADAGRLVIEQDGGEWVTARWIGRQDKEGAC